MLVLVTDVEPSLTLLVFYVLLFFGLAGLAFFQAPRKKVTKRPSKKRPVRSKEKHSQTAVQKPIAISYVPAQILSIATEVENPHQGQAYRKFAARHKEPTSSDELHDVKEETSIALRLGVAAARRAIVEWKHQSDITLEDSLINHIVVQSCTSYGLSLEHHLIRDLNLCSSTRTIAVNNVLSQLGAFTTLFVAKQIVERDPNAVVLVVCTDAYSIVDGEISTLEEEKQKVMIGGAAALVIGTCVKCPHNGWLLGSFLSDILRSDEYCLRNNTQFQQLLFEQKAQDFFYDTLLKRGLAYLLRCGVEQSWECAWAICPRNENSLPSLRKVFNVLHMNGQGLDKAKKVLHEYGNMLSATILFVLSEVLETQTSDEIFLVSFGSDLSIEYGRLYRYADDATRDKATKAYSSFLSPTGAR